MKQIDQLCEVEKLRGLASRRLLAQVQAREADLRQQILSVQTFRSELHGVDPKLSHMRAIGGDVLWAKWLDRTQIRLNTSLARVLSEKETVLRKARKDIGRSESITAMREKVHRENQQVLQKSQAETILALSVLAKLNR